MTYDLRDAGLLLRPDVLADPKPLHDQLRREAPIWQIPGQDTFVVSDPGLIKEAVGRTDDFSSNIVFVIHDDGNGCPVPHRISNYRDPIHVLSTADPPDHTRHRRMVQPNLSPAALAELETEVEQIVDDHLARVLVLERHDVDRDARRLGERRRLLEAARGLVSDGNETAGIAAITASRATVTAPTRSSFRSRRATAP